MAKTNNKSQPKRLRLSMEFTSREEMESFKQKAKDKKMSVSNYLRLLAKLPSLTRGGYRGYPPPRTEESAGETPTSQPHKITRNGKNDSN